MSLRAPVAVPVEIRSDGEAGRRVFRLAASVGEDGVRLVGPAPFEIGRPVDVAFTLPRGKDAATTVRLKAEVLHADQDDETANEGAGGRELTFIEPTAEARVAIRNYVRERLSLPE